MHVIELKNTLDRLVNLINHRCTGSPEELAQRLSVSDRTVKRYIAQLRELGADIRFCPHRNSYYFAIPVTFRFGFESDDTHPENGGGKAHIMNHISILLFCIAYKRNFYI